MTVMSYPASVTWLTREPRFGHASTPGLVASRLQLTYAITPPNRTTSLERRTAIAAAQSQRIAGLPVDAVLVYDLQDETSRNSDARPFPFVQKVDPLDYAFGELRLGALPRVVYRALAGQGEADVQRWITRLHALGGLAVFVGAPSRDSGALITLPQVYSTCRERAPLLPFGGVLIAERHQKSRDEDQRVWAKVEHGCSFFVSQTMWSAPATSALLRDLKVRAEITDAPLPTLLSTLSPCGSEQSLRFQEWLGVHVPPAIKRELLSARDMLARSIDLCVEVFAEAHALAEKQGIVLGCNVESASTRAAEVDASVELTRRIAQYLARGSERSQAVPPRLMAARVDGCIGRLKPEIQRQHVGRGSRELLEFTFRDLGGAECAASAEDHVQGELGEKLTFVRTRR